MKPVLIACIRFYQNWVSPVFPATCRFFPSCSTYAMEALERFGVVKGTVLTVRRLVKCHPWHPGGFDPVPSKGKVQASGRGESPGKKSFPGPAFR